MSEVIAAVEGGGTNFNCALFDLEGRLLVRQRFATAKPKATIEQCAAFIKQSRRGSRIIGAGLACFGPLDLRRGSSSYGAILATPKPGWESFKPKASLEDALEVPVSLTTDVGGSALGEHHAGVARNTEDFVYITVGTGIGVAAFLGGRLLEGASHPELGHCSVRRVAGDSFLGNCPFHGDCVSGLASGPAIEARWGKRGEELPPEHRAWDFESAYLAQLCTTAIYAYAPQAVVLGGGVMAAPGLLDRIKIKLGKLLGAYHDTFVVDAAGAPRVVAPGLGGDSALYGAFALARSELER